MATGNSPAKEEDWEAQKAREEVIATGISIVEMAQRCKTIVVEVSNCPHCGGSNIHYHGFSEVLGCMHEECKKRYASRVRRPPLPGEMLAEHYQFALGVLWEANQSMIRAGLAPLEQAEMQALPPETQALIVRHFARISRDQLIKFNELANTAAQRNMT